MASFNGNIGTPSGGFNLKVEYSISQSVSGNYSDVTATGYVKRNNSSYYPYNSQSSSSLSINGTSKGYSGSYDLRSDGYKTIVSNTVRVYHNSDGTKSITISFSFNGLLSSYYPNGSISKTITLPTIPRASDVACSSPYIGDTATITISKKASGFTSTVSYKIGTLSGTLATKTSDTVLSLPTSDLVDNIYSQIPSSKSIQGTITCQTYNGSTLIGTKTCNFNLYAKEEECKPTINGTVIDTNEKTIAITGDNTKLIKYISKPKVTIEATPNKSSSIVSYSINLNDGQTSSNQENTFDSISSNIVTINAVDSRGYSNPVNIDVSENLIDYIKLMFNDIELSRPEETSNEVLLNANGVWFNGSFSETIINSLTIDYKYRKSGDTDWIDGGEITPTINDNSFSFYNYLLGDIYSYEEEYQFLITIKDVLMEIPTIETCHKGKAVIEIEDGLVNINGILTVNDQNITSSDTLPIGAIVEYDGDTIPDGYEEVEYYSTEETEIGTWIDGKPIYRRIVTASVPNSGNQVISFSGWNAENIILDHGKSYHKLTNNNTIGIDFYYNSNDWSRFYINSNGVYCHYGSGLTAKGNVTLFLEYTKTTD